MKIRLILLLVLLATASCGGSSVSDLIDEVEDFIDLALDPPERKPIDVSRMGVNNFFVNRQFGSIDEQFLEIRDTLGIRSVRILLAWTTDVQPSPDAAPNYSFFDEIIAAIPPGVDVVAVLAHTPSWMTDPANWVGEDPRLTWVEKWLRPTVSRYAGVPGLIGWEVWNEPDLLVVPSDVVLELENPQQYFDLLVMASSAIRSLDPADLILIAATSSIQQNFSAHLDYNRALRDLGAEALVDIWNVHYYGKQYEKVIQDDGIADFLNSLNRAIWITESGESGPNQQLAYVERTWPFLREKIPSIDRIYFYEFSSTAPRDSSFGLRLTDAEFPVSDLYISLRDR